jgi:hypothetical protein
LHTSGVEVHKFSFRLIEWIIKVTTAQTRRDLKHAVRKALPLGRIEIKRRR